MAPDSERHGLLQELDVVAGLRTSTGAPVDVRLAAKVLDEDHYDLEKVEDRILDFLRAAIKTYFQRPDLVLHWSAGIWEGRR